MNERELMRRLGRALFLFMSGMASLLFLIMLVVKTETADEGTLAVAALLVAWYSFAGYLLSSGRF